MEEKQEKVFIIREKFMNDEQKRVFNNYLWRKHIVHETITEQEFKEMMASIIQLQQGMKFE